MPWLIVYPPTAIWYEEREAQLSQRYRETLCAKIWGRLRSLEIVAMIEFYINFVSVLYGLWDITAYFCDIASF